MDCMGFFLNQHWKQLTKYQTNTTVSTATHEGTVRVSRKGTYRYYQKRSMTYAKFRDVTRSPLLAKSLNSSIKY